MKKVSLCLSIFLLSLIAFTACDLPQNAVLSESDEAKKEADKKKEKVATPFWGQAWFSGDAEYMFIEADGQKYIRYLPDSLNDSLYLQVKSEDTEKHVINAVVKYSKDSIREMGTPVKFTYVSEDNKLTIKADDSNTAKFKTIFTASDMAKFDGVEVRKFNIPAVETVYLSNLDGNYTLKDLGWKLQIKSKVCIEKDVNHSWFAHAVDVKEANGIYEFLLCHDSNADTGITGDSSKEPFINSQATVWSYMKLYSKPDSTETTVVEWSSQWYSSPYEVLNSSLDQKDSIAYSISEITYKYTFYFGHSEERETSTPGVKFWYIADNKTEIKTITKTSHVPLNTTWKDLFASVKSEVESTIPDGKEIDYWWYSKGTFGVNQEGLEYKLKDSTDIFLNEYDFYCTLKDKKQDEEQINVLINGSYNSTYNNTITHTLIINEKQIIIDNDEYELCSIILWQKTNYYNDYAILLKKDNINYISTMKYQLPTETSVYYYNIRAPQEYSGELPSEYNYDLCGEYLNNGGKYKTSKFYLVN